MRSVYRFILPLLLLACLPSAAVHAAETYSWGHPQPQGNAVHNIVFLDADRGWAVAGDATVLATEDGGLSWQVLDGPHPAGPELNDLAVLSPTELVAVGEGIFRSTDGGSSWVAVATPGLGELMDLTEIPGGGLSATGEGGAVLVSFDGGLTWTDVGPGTGTGRHHLWRNAQEGFVVGIQLAHRTTDGGATWTEVAGPPQFQFNEIFFEDDQNAVIVEDFGTWRSSDGGATWTEFFNPTPPLYRHRTLQITQDHLLVVCLFEGGDLWESVDGGTTWNQLQFTSISGFGCLVQTPGGRIVWGSTVGDLYWSDDLGHTIHNATHTLTAATPGAAIDKFMVRPDGVIFAANLPSNWLEDMAWLRSDDGGHSWHAPLNSPDNRWIYAAGFLDNATGMTAHQNKVNLTIDGGATWTLVELDEDRGTWQCALPAADRFYLASSRPGGGDLLLSTDGGHTWNPAGGGLPAGSFQCGTVFFVDELTGFTSGAVGASRRLYRTVDGGQSWQQLAATGLPASPTDLHFFDAVTGLAGTYQDPNPGIYRTIDGGASWVRVHDQRSQELEFRDGQSGVSIRKFANIGARTEDGGQTWTEFAAPFSSPGHGIHTGNLNAAAPTAEGWVFGGPGGAILVATDDAVLSAVDDGDRVPSTGTARLLQVAPNPFNPRTTISFEMARTGQVKVSVYDVSGRRVRNLLQGERAAGIHHLIWDGSDDDGRPRAAGVYLVRVQTQGGIDFQKVSMVK